MKKFVLSVLCALVSVSAFGQGTIALSNIGKTPVTVDGAPAGAGVLVGFAAADGTDIIAGTQGAVLGAGFFSAGSKTLAGLTGDVQLRLAGKVAAADAWQFSAPFSVTLGGSGTPPSPAAALPNGVSLNIVTIPEPSTIALGLLGGAALLFRRRK